MIAKFAQRRGIGGGRLSPAMTVPGNDNRVRRVLSDPQRMPKRVLTCRWRVRPQTGALECVWETQAAKRPADAVTDEDPNISQFNRRACGVRHGVVSGATDCAAAA
jgi:hypothetical protein